MREAASGIILAGGRSRRMGRDKKELMLGGETLLARTVRVMGCVADEVVVVGRPDVSVDDLGSRPVDDQGRGCAIGTRRGEWGKWCGQGRSHRSPHEPSFPSNTISVGWTLVPDEVSEAGPLGGLLSGMRRVRSPWAIAVACDLPFLDPVVLGFLLELAAGYQAVVPHVGGRDQPLHAVYSRTVLDTVERHVAAGQLELSHLLADLEVRRVEESELRRLDPELRSFLNVNTPDEWEEALRMWEASASGHSPPRP